MRAGLAWLGAGLLAGLLALPAQADQARIQAVTAAETGVEAWFVPDDSLPLVALEMRFAGGLNLEPEGKPGTAALADRLLTEGAGDMDATAFNAALDKAGVQLSIDVGREATTVSLKALRNDLARGAELLATALAEPRFDPAAIERAKRNQAGAIAERENSPHAQGYRRLRDKVMGSDHPYGRPFQGNREALKQIDASDLHAFADAQFARDNVDVAAAGAIDGARLGELVDTVFAELPETSGDTATPPIEPAFDGSTTVLARELPQTLLFAAAPGVTRDDPAFYAADLLNEVLGGDTFLSRLGRELRGKRGLAYSAGAQMLVYERAGMQLLRASTGNRQAGEAFTAMGQIYRELGRNGPTREELAAAKERIIGALPLRLTSTDGLASVVLSLKENGLGRDYLQRRTKLIREVTRQDVADLARELLPAGKLTTVAVGQPQGIETSE